MTTDKLHNMITTIKLNKICILGDLNDRTGKAAKSLVVTKYGEETKNNNGKWLIDLCENQNLKIINGFYTHSDAHKFTYIQATRNIDYWLLYTKTNIQSPNKWREGITRARVWIKPPLTNGNDYQLLKQQPPVTER